MIRKILLSLLGLVLLILAFAAAIVLFKSEELKKKAIATVNQNLAEPVMVKDVKLSFSQFPDLAISIDDAFCRGSNSTAGDTLFYFGHSAMVFDLWQALGGDFKLKSVEVEDGVVHIDERGEQSNYLITKQSENSDKSGVDINSIGLKNIHLTFAADKVDIFQTRIIDTKLQGRFIEEPEFNIDSKFSKTAIYWSTDSLIVSEAWQFQSIYHQTSAFTKMRNWRAEFANALTISGNLENIREELVVEYEVNDALERILQFYQQSGLPGYDILGSLDFQRGNILLKGKYFSDPDRYSVTGNFTLENLDLKYRKSLFEQGAINGSFETGFRNNFIDIEKGEFSTREGQLKVAGYFKNFETQPELDLQMQGDLGLQEFVAISGSEDISEARGKISADIKYYNRFASIDHMNGSGFAKGQLSADLGLEQCSFKLNDYGAKLKKVNGALSADQNNLNIKRLYASKGESDLYLQGYFENLFPYLFEENQKLKAFCKVISQNLKLEDFMGGENENSEVDFIRYFSDLDLNLELDLGALQFRNFTANNITGKLRAQQQNLELNELNMDFAQGNIKGKLRLKAVGEKILLKSDFSARKLDAKRLFAAFDNFGQQTLTSRNIDGRTSVDASVQATIDSTFSLNPASIVSQVDLNIEDGRLEKFEPMEALANYAELEQLRDVRFSKISNTLTISDQKITIPQFDISSNVMDLNFYGTHHFNNVIDYHLKLKVREILSKKEKQQAVSKELEDHIYERETGDEPYIYILMTGTVEEPAIKFDRQAWGRAVKEDLKRQVKELKKDTIREDDPGIKYEWDGF